MNAIDGDIYPEHHESMRERWFGTFNSEIAPKMWVGVGEHRWLLVASTTVCCVQTQSWCVGKICSGPYKNGPFWLSGWTWTHSGTEIWEPKVCASASSVSASCNVKPWNLRNKGEHDDQPLNNLEVKKERKLTTNPDQSCQVAQTLAVFAFRCFRKTPCMTWVGTPQGFGPCVAITSHRKVGNLKYELNIGKHHLYPGNATVMFNNV